MAALLAIVLAPIVFALVAIYAVQQLVVLVVRVAFAPVVWLSRQPRRQRVELRHYRAK